MRQIFISIQQEATGKRMKELFMKNGYTVRDVQQAMGFENPQAVYKWLSGRSIPSIDNLLVLSRLLHVSIEEILVVDGDFCHFKGLFHFEDFSRIYRIWGRYWIGEACRILAEWFERSKKRGRNGKL